MRRAKPISVVVKAPTRGLVTRLPSLSADLLPTQSSEVQGTLLSASQMQRAAAAAQNVRYEDGVVCSAPGYQRIALLSALLQKMVAYWPLQEASGMRYDATPGYNNLTDVPGTSTEIPDILSDVGIIGPAALFPSLPPAVIAGLIVDLLSLDAALASGGYTLRVLGANIVVDYISLDAALESGAYTATVIVSTAPNDSISLDAALESGTYTALIIPESDQQDSMSANSTLFFGAYIQILGIFRPPPSP